ncbi:MAG: DUF5106 domain-containing protein, partial [Prevotellaceae bacterium]|nr:DUF5106 domain-containing protein [Prevotellaceae bacterium]
LRYKHIYFIVFIFLTIVVQAYGNAADRRHGGNPVSFLSNRLCVMWNRMKYHNYKILMRQLVWIIAVALSFAACNRKENADTADTGSQTVSYENGDELPMPAIPSTLGSSSERSSYVTEHFWDAMDFSDTLQSHNREFLERNFSNFIYLLPHAPASAAEKAVALLMKKAGTDKTAFLILTELAEKYLSEPDSPMRNEDLFILFLKCQIDAEALDESRRIRARSLLDVASKNRPGMAATDFAYIDSKNLHCTLYGTKSADNMLLVFYDPECEHCGEIINSLVSNEILIELQEKKCLTVLAIDTESDSETWERTKHNMPCRWIVGHDSKHSINERMLYDLPAMPVLYLLDADKTVILKDAAPNAVLQELIPQEADRK